MRLKRYDDALKAFDQAVELDVCPLRATNAIHSAITRLPETHPRVQLINFRGNLKALCRTELGHECFGEEYFLDHVHPTIDTHRQLALWIIEGLQRSKLLPPGTIGLNELDRVASELEGQLTSEERGVAMRNLAKVLHWAGKFSEAAPRAEDALEELPNDAESLFILAECHRHAGRFIDSFDAFQQLLKHHPNDSRALLPYGVVLVELNEFEAAKGQLMTGLLDDPDSAFGYHWLGLAHLGLEEYEDAKGALLQADSRSSGDPSTLYYLGVACEGLRQWEQAEKHYRQVIEKSPQHAGTRNRLGWVLVELKRPQEAVKQFQAALDIDPTLREAQENLDFARDIFASEL